MNKRLTTDMPDANGLQRAIRPNGFFQHQENGRRFPQRAMHNGQYWVFNIKIKKFGDFASASLNSERRSRVLNNYE